MENISVGNFSSTSCCSLCVSEKRKRVKESFIIAISRHGRKFKFFYFLFWVKIIERIHCELKESSAKKIIAHAHTHNNFISIEASVLQSESWDNFRSRRLKKLELLISEWEYWEEWAVKILCVHTFFHYKLSISLNELWSSCSYAADLFSYTFFEIANKQRENKLCAACFLSHSLTRPSNR